jgi:cytochrome c-type biogenesis protein
MEQILTVLSGFMEGPAYLVLAGSFLWGLASILLSPCHLASIPLIVGYIARQNNAGAKKSVLLSIVFSLGVFIVLAVIGGVTAGMGRMMGNMGKPITFALAGLLIFVGLFTTGLISFPEFGRSLGGTKIKSGYKGAFLLGLLFGAGLGPCAFAFMIPVLTAAFASAHTAPVYAASLVSVYALGHCILIALAGASAGAVSKWLSFNESSSVLKSIRIICGLLVVCAGAYLFAKTW